MHRVGLGAWDSDTDRRTDRNIANAPNGRAYSNPTPRENWNRITSVRRNQEKKAFLLWTHIEKRGKLLGERNNTQGTTSGRRHQVRPRACCREDNITVWTGLKADLLLRSAEDRSRWRRIVHEAANPRLKTRQDSQQTVTSNSNNFSTRKTKQSYIYIGISDVAGSMATILSPFCGYNMA